MISFSIAEDELRHLPGAGHGRRLRGVELLPEPRQPRRTASSSGKFKARYGSRPRDQRRDRGGVQQRPVLGAGRRRGRDRRRRRGDQGGPAAEHERTGGDHLDRRGDPAHLAAGLHRPGSAATASSTWSGARRRPVRPIPYPTSRPQSHWEAFLDELHQALERLGQPRAVAGPATGRRHDPERRPGVARPSRRRPASGRPGRPPPRGVPRRHAASQVRRASASPVDERSPCGCPTTLHAGPGRRHLGGSHPPARVG